MQERCIIYISSSNYKKVAAGTEKFINELTGLFIKDKVHSIHFFPLSRVNNYINKFGLAKNFIGVNYDGVFQGVYLIEDLESAIAYLEQRYNVKCDRVIINQLHDWNLQPLEKLMHRMKLSVIVVVHDYMMVCPYIMLDDRDKFVCGRVIDKPSKKRCMNCVYSDKALGYYYAINAFFESINQYICRIVFPSKSAEANWLAVYPLFSDRAVIRPHLEYKTTVITKKWPTKIKIGYLGTISELKGYEEWVRLLRCLDKEKFEFFYFGKGTGIAEKDGANAVYVDSNSDNSPKMADQLKENQIDVAFLWSKCLETYSYTYFEAYEAGCFILTSNASGNITDQVKINMNGETFNSLNDCIVFLNNNDWKTRISKIDEVKPNRSVEEFSPILPYSINVAKTKKPAFLMTLLYRCLRSS